MIYVPNNISDGTYLLQIQITNFMSVEPGFGGQGYVDGSTERVAEVF